MVLIAHLSDLHVGAHNHVEKTLLDSIDQVNNLNPDLIVLTGDLTDNGYYLEFLKVNDYLDLFENPVMVVPGNHDARHVGNETFEEIFHNRSGTLSNDTDDLTVIGLDSSEPDLDYGKVGRPQQVWMEDELLKAQKNNQYKIIALHHHIIPVPKTGRERNVLADAGDILHSLTNNNVDLVISGHKHVPHVWKLQNTVFVTAGTVSSLKLRGKDSNSFNTYNIEKNALEINLNQVNGKKHLMAKFENKCSI
ncbi:MAG: metallophosphoesterase [Methanobacteriaceae archaeon]|nr:metallophosphoesterase [Methanobacteriaceae archaeon]MDP2837435.1 metallophosphoesterase [Methanobacteriaceae archaeon]MDP3035214.1 metallophosphoesterase [Methanobacteriaceae archaeon]MDP3484418.1 metallophosphoesterase [Methanobacteriaceae archaeon]